MYFKELAKLSGAIKSRLAWSIVKKSPLILNILDALWNAKIILGYSLQNDVVVVFFKHSEAGTPVIKNFSIISTPGKRKFKKYKFFIGSPITNIYILNTSQGILQDSDAIKKKLGGEVLLKIIL